MKYFLLLPDLEYVDSPYDAITWGAVLKSVNAFEMYCKKFHRIHYKEVAHFLVFDKLFPRSMLYCVSKALVSLGEILGDSSSGADVKHEMEVLQNMLLSNDVDSVLNSGLHEFVDAFQLNLNFVDDVLFKSFFERVKV